MRVATINIWGHSGDWDARRTALQRSIAELRPDLLALQETFEDAADLCDGYEVVHQERRSPDGGGISIASRVPVREVHELDLHVSKRPREFAAGALMVETKNVLFVNHFPSWQLDQENEREEQAVMVARKIEELGPMHVVVAGDMDADPHSSSIRFWTGRQPIRGMSVCYRDAWEAKHLGEAGETVNFAGHEDWPFRRIDYIFVRCGVHGGPTMKIERCERWLDEPVGGVWGSDHFGVFADLA
jgi:endonuclease/exonuclease/phosphatase family metal-dependent hydrolase